MSSVFKYEYNDCKTTFFYIFLNLKKKYIYKNIFLYFGVFVILPSENSAKII